MKDEIYPPVEEYYCKKCKNRFVPAYYPILCTACSSENVVLAKSLRVPDRDWEKDPSYLEYIMRNKDKGKE